MPLDLTTARRGSVEHLAMQGGTALASLPPAVRFVLRCRPDGIAPIGSVFGVELPQAACRAVPAGERAAL